MNFKRITIKNFRNFKNTEISLSNKNIFFGLNDVGKTNLMYAFRFLFDKEIRKQKFSISDYHCKNINEEIEIMIEINISDVENKDNQKLRAKLSGALLSEHETVYIKLVGKYEESELNGIPILYWGGDLEHLYEMNQRGYLYDIDYIMNVIYIDSYVDLYTLFKKNLSTLIKNDEPHDKELLNEISTLTESINHKISSLSGIKKFENEINPEYEKFRIRQEKTSITIKSKLAINGLYSNIVPYIKQEEEEELYPTAGEGRKKLLSYSIFDLLANETIENKIIIFLIEEPENHLHKSMQIALSKILFNDKKYNYLFISTHSPYILYEMDSVNLIRIYNKNKVNTASSLYEVPIEYHQQKKRLNKNLSEAIFSDRVLLVEGVSEVILFEKILITANSFYEANGNYILPVNGIGFEKYYKILKSLNIDCYIKTDNDLRKAKSKNNQYSVLSFFRINKLINKKLLPLKKLNKNTLSIKKKLYKENKNLLDQIRKEYNIFLSKTDLENDLYEVLKNDLKIYLKNEKPVDYLKESKHYHMVELIEKLSDVDCSKILNHYNFEFLKELI